MVVDKEIGEEYRLEDLLMCPRCGMPFVNVVDKISGELNKHLFKPNCSCYKKDVRISVG